MAMGTSKSNGSKGNQEVGLLDWQQLRKAGHSYREIGELIGRSPDTVKGWIRRYGLEEPPSKPLKPPKPKPMEPPLRCDLPQEDIEAVLLLREQGYSYKQIGSVVDRAYSTIRRWALHFTQDNPPPLQLRQPRKTELPLRCDLPQDDVAAFLQLRREGYSCGQIGKILGRTKDAMKHWGRKYFPSEAQLPIRRHITCAEDWRRRLHAGIAAVPKNNPRIFLVCGTQKSGRSLENLLAIIRYRLRLNPCSGDIYVFCGQSQKTLRSVQWDGGGLRIIKRRSQRGRYPWPPVKLGPLMEINQDEYELLLSYTTKRNVAKKP